MCIQIYVYMCIPGTPDSNLCVVVTVDHRSCFLRERCLCESSAPAVHGQHCGMDPMFFDVCERVVALQHFPGVIMKLYLSRLSKTLARLVTQCGKVHFSEATPRAAKSRCSVLNRRFPPSWYSRRLSQLAETESRRSTPRLQKELNLWRR